MIQISEAEARRRGGPTEAPPDNPRTYINKRTGEETTVPSGVDPAFAVNWGAAPQPRRRTDVGFSTLERIDAKIAAAGARSWPELAKDLDASFPEIVGAIHESRKLIGAAFSVGIIDGEVQAALRAMKIDLGTAVIGVTDKRLKHILREHKATRPNEPDLALGDVLRLPEILREPKAILWDKGPEGGAPRDRALVYVFDPLDEDEKRLGKLIVRVNFEEAGRGERLGNWVRSGGLVETADLRTSRYRKIRGDL